MHNYYLRYSLFLALLFLTQIVFSQRIKKSKYNNDILWKQSKIPVCWENPEEKNSTEREWVKQAVTDSWQKESKVEFADWCPCKKESQGLRILISDDKDGSRVVALGSKLNGIQNGMILNFTFKKWGTGLIPGEVPNRKAAIEAIAVHEFGHALGLTHQQIRDSCYLCDIPNEQIKKEITYETSNTSSADGLWFTPCDPYSVMNYCNSSYFNFGKLSNYDKQAVRILYGTPISIDTIKNLRIEYTAKLLPTQTRPDKVCINQQTQDGRLTYKVLKYHWYLINLYIYGNNKDLDNIKKVEYSLDPSFKNNTYEITNRQASFRTSFFAYGNFIVKATVYFKNGTSINIEKELDKIPPIKILVKEYTRNSGLPELVPRVRKIGRKGG